MTASQLVLALLSAVLLWAGWLNLFGPDFIRAEFRDWGYSDRLRIAVGLAEWAAAISLQIPSARPLGCALAAAILLGVIFTFLRHRMLMRLEYPLVLLALVVLAGAQTAGLLP